MGSAPVTRVLAEAPEGSCWIKAVTGDLRVRLKASPGCITGGSPCYGDTQTATGKLSGKTKQRDRADKAGRKKWGVGEVGCRGEGNMIR